MTKLFHTVICSSKFDSKYVSVNVMVCMWSVLFFSHIGIYVCAKCGYELFSSRTKYEHSSPWPAFTETIHEDSVSKKEERWGAYKVDIIDYTPYTLSVKLTNWKRFNMRFLPLIILYCTFLVLHYNAKTIVCCICIFGSRRSIWN